MKNRNMNIGYSEHFQNKLVSVVLLKNSFGKYIVSVQNKQNGDIENFEFNFKKQGKVFFEKYKELNSF